MTQLIIQYHSGQPRAALLSDRRLVEYFELNEDPAQNPEAVLLGRAGRVMKNLKAMFVQLPGQQEGFLPFDEMPPGVKVNPGDALIVQIRKPARGEKAAFLTMDIGLAGRLVMLLPKSAASHVSKRAGDRGSLALLAEKLRPQGMGLVLRASAEGAAEADIACEVEKHLTVWREIESKARLIKAPALLFPAPGPIERLLRDAQSLPERVVTDDLERSAWFGLPQSFSDRPFALFQVEQQLQDARRRRVYLPSGGTLVLDPCEAATLIDVNTAKDTKKNGDAWLRANIEAAAEIARLLRLRRVGGIILIDFIDMREESQRETVLQAIREALLEDPVTSEVLGFTRLGLLEMTRRKADVPLPAQRLTPCPRCHGTGLSDAQEETEYTDA